MLATETYDILIGKLRLELAAKIMSIESNPIKLGSKKHPRATTTLYNSRAVAEGDNVVGNMIKEE